MDRQRIISENRLGTAQILFQFSEGTHYVFSDFDCQGSRSRRDRCDSRADSLGDAAHRFAQCRPVQFRLFQCLGIGLQSILRLGHGRFRIVQFNLQVLNGFAGLLNAVLFILLHHGFGGFYLVFLLSQPFLQQLLLTLQRLCAFFVSLVFSRKKPHFGGCARECCIDLRAGLFILPFAADLYFGIDRLFFFRAHLHPSQRPVNICHFFRFLRKTIRVELPVKPEKG